MTTNLHDKMLAAIDAYFSASNEIEAHVAEEQLLDVRDEINKHKLAAESLNEGLRLDDWAKIGCVNHDCDKCKALAEQPAQQEPTQIGRPHRAVMGDYGAKLVNQRIEAAVAESRKMQAKAAEHPADTSFDGGGRQPAQQDPVATLFGSLPVYDTTPQAQPALEPLTNAQIREVLYKHQKSLYEAHGIDTEGMKIMDDSLFTELLGYVKAVLAAHGITKGNT